MMMCPYGSFPFSVASCVKPGPHQQQIRSNIVEATGNCVACCFDIVAGVDGALWSVQTAVGGNKQTRNVDGGHGEGSFCRCKMPMPTVQRLDST